MGRETLSFTWLPREKSFDFITSSSLLPKFESNTAGLTALPCPPQHVHFVSSLTLDSLMVISWMPGDEPIVMEWSSEGAPQFSSGAAEGLVAWVNKQIFPCHVKTISAGFGHSAGPGLQIKRSCKWKAEVPPADGITSTGRRKGR